MSFNKHIRIVEHPARADQSAVIRINPSQGVRQEAGPSVGARVVDEGLGAAFIAFMVARGREAIPFLQAVSQGNRTRATIKALPAAPHHPRPYGIPDRRLRLMPIRADQSAVGAINRPLLYNRIILLKVIITTIVNCLELL